MSKVLHIPEGYNSITPHLIIKGAAQAIDYYKKVFGATEIMRQLDFLKHIFGPTFDPTQYRMLLVGLAMVLMMIWRPRGLITTRTPSVFLKERKVISADLVKEGRG